MKLPNNFKKVEVYTIQYKNDDDGFKIACFVKLHDVIINLDQVRSIKPELFKNYKYKTATQFIPRQQIDLNTQVINYCYISFIDGKHIECGIIKD